MAKETVGVEVGSGAVKVVQLVHGRNAYQLKALGSIDIPSARTADVTQQAGVVGGVVRSLLDRQRVSPKRLVSSVGGESVVVRKIQVPYMRESELDRAIRWEAEEYIPYPINQVSLGYDILETGTAGGENREMSVLLVGVRNETLETHLQVLRSGGLSPQVVDVDALALFNSYVWNRPEAGAGTALIGIGHRRTDIVLIEEQYPFLVRSVESGGFHITQNLAEELGVGYAEAERLKRDYGLVGVGEEAEAPEAAEVDEELQTRIDEAIRRTLEELVGEIIHSFEYYTSHTEGSPVNRAVLSGGTALLRNLDRFLSEELQVPVVRANPFENIGYDEAVFNPGALAPAYAVAVGLALRKVNSYD